MSDRNDQKRAVAVRIIVELEKRGVRVVLNGGLALDMHAMQERQRRIAEDEDADPPPILQRPTKDVDIMVLLEHVATARAVRAALGLHAEVDILATTEGDPRRQDELAVYLPRGASPVEWVTGQHTILVAEAAVLVCQKALAWANRYEERDLYDLGRLAIIDGENKGTIRDRLIELDPAPFVWHAFDRVSTQFEDDLCYGSSLYVRTAAKETGYRATELGGLVSAYARRLYAPLSGS